MLFGIPGTFGNRLKTLKGIRFSHFGDAFCRYGFQAGSGGGLFVDNEIGGASATGLGEEVLKTVGSFLIVELMRQGKSPQEACEDAIGRIVNKPGKDFKNFQVGYIAVNKKGETGAYSIHEWFSYNIYKDKENKNIKSEIDSVKDNSKWNALKADQQKELATRLDNLIITDKQGIDGIKNILNAAYNVSTTMRVVNEQIAEYTKVTPPPPTPGTTTRKVNLSNLPKQIKKKLKTKDGGARFLYATTLKDNKKAFIMCKKVD